MAPTSIAAPRTARRTLAMMSALLRSRQLGRHMTRRRLSLHLDNIPCCLSA
jgi:hypothetical protein